MLILSRKPGESLIIGENGEIKITILSMKSNQTRIGIDAPKDISVHREEIYQRIHNKNSQEINDESGKDK